MGKTVSGPGKLGSVKAVKASLKKKGNANIRNVPSESSLTVRFLEEPPEWHGYYEHFVDGTYQPCVTDECPGCNSDDSDEKRKSFRYLANGYVVDDQKVQAIKMPKSLVESLMQFYTKYDGTIMDRDYELTRTGSGQFDTKYTAIPESPSKMKLSRFADKMFDLEDVLNSLIEGEEDDDDDDDEPVKKSKKSKGAKKEKSPWEEDDDRPKKKKSKSKGESKSSPSVKKKKPAAKKTVARKTIKRKTSK